VHHFSLQAILSVAPVDVRRGNYQKADHSLRPLVLELISFRLCLVPGLAPRGGGLDGVLRDVECFHDPHRDRLRE